MKSKILSSYLALVTSALLYGFLVFGGKLMSVNGFSLIEILIYPNLIVFLILLVTTKPEIKKFFSFPAKVSILYIISVISIQFGQYAPLFMGLSVSLTVFLLYTQPLWTSLISVLFLKTKFTSKDAILMATTFLGLIFLLSPWKEFSFSIAGFLLALMGGIAMAGWISINGAFYAKKVKPLTTTFFTNVYQSVPFIIMYPLFAKFFPDNAMSGISLDRSILAITLVFAYSIFVYIGASILFYSAAKKINNVHLGLVLLLEPVVATILDVAFLGTTLTWNIVFGGALILVANAYLVIMSANKEIKE